MSEAKQKFIDETVKSNDVVVFMKGNQDFPMCGFSAQVAHIFQHLNVEFTDVNVLDDQEIRRGIKHYTNWPTIPQIFVKGEFIGGCDIAREMFENGELKQLLQEKGIAHNEAA